MGDNLGPRRDSNSPRRGFQSGRVYGSWIGDGEANSTLAAAVHRSCSMAAGDTSPAWSGRFAVGVPEHAGEPIAALDFTGGEADFPARIDESVVEA